MENIDIYDSLLLQIENLDEYNEDRIEIYKKQAEQGDYKAQYKLGEKYYKGFELKRDLDEADRLFTSSYRTCSMRGDDPEALYYIFLMNFNGYGIPKNNERAFDFCKKSAELGCDDAKFQLAIMYFNGYGVKQNYLEAIKLLEELSKIKKENVSANAKFFLGLAYKTLIENKNIFSIKNVKKYIKESDKNFKSCIKFYESRAKQSDSLSQFRLGYIYLNGLGIKKDIEKALELFKKSAELGYSDSEYQLGKHYRAIADFGESLKYFEKSACKGNLKSLYKLGEIYQYGFNAVSKDYKKSIEYYIKSAEFGYNEANIKIDSFVENYKGSKKQNNYDDDNKNEEENIEQVYATFWEYFEKLAEKENAFALYRLGQMYENGLGIGLYNKKAFVLYKKSAERGYARAQYALGQMYEIGKGTAIDNEQAKYWLGKATLDGYDYLSNLHTDKDYSVKLHAQQYIDNIKRKEHIQDILNFRFLLLPMIIFSPKIIFFHLIGEKRCIECLRKKCLKYLRYSENFPKMLSDIRQYLICSLWFLDKKSFLKIALYYLALLFDKKDFIFDFKKVTPVLKFFLYFFYKKYSIFRYKEKYSSYGYSFDCIDYDKLNKLNNKCDIAVVFYAISSYFGNNKSRRNLENIALQNNSLAQYYIGNIYLKGLSEKQDYDKAIFYFSLAGEQGNMFAQLTLADLYLSGNDIEINYDKAIYWYSKAGEHKNKNACHRLGEIYQDVKKDYNQAIYWYNKSVKFGNKYDILVIGTIYKELAEISENDKYYEEIMDLYSKFVDSLDESDIFYKYVAEYRLGLIYKDIKKDYDQAIYWFSKILEKSDKNCKKIDEYNKYLDEYKYKAQSQLGYIYIQLANIYEQGKEVEQDISKAIEYYKKSLGYGELRAKKALERLENK